jgi:cell division septation protein DedD
MEQKQRLFIYDRKEMAVLILLAVMVAVFAFTLGVHLGKRVGGAEMAAPVAIQPSPAPTQPDEVPNRQDIAEQTPAAQQASDEALNRELHDEVSRTGIKMDTPRQVELPEKSRVKSIPAANRPTPHGKYTLQVGSHQKLDEANDQVEALEALGLKPFLRQVDLKAKGRWYRVYLGGFTSREDAEQSGASYRAKKMIESFIVSNMTQ